jgi:hypothetical protein
MLLRGVIFSVLLTGLFPTGHAQPGESAWPDIVPLDASIYFADASKASAQFKILDPKGKPLYILDCRNWRMASGIDFDYSGDFECRLTSTYSRDPTTSLLSEPQHTKSWESRGRALGDEMIEKCANYPEYGRVRHFRLRRMKIIFAFDELRFKSFEDPSRPKLKKFEFQSLRFTLRVERDPAAHSSIAESTPLAYPPSAHPEDPNDFSLNCDVVMNRKIKAGRRPLAAGGELKGSPISRQVK